jgi:hypothetical protein
LRRDRGRIEEIAVCALSPESASRSPGSSKRRKSLALLLERVRDPELLFEIQRELLAQRLGE